MRKEGEYRNGNRLWILGNEKATPTAKDEHGLHGCSRIDTDKPKQLKKSAKPWLHPCKSVRIRAIRVRLLLLGFLDGRLGDGQRRDGCGLGAKDGWTE